MHVTIHGCFEKDDKLVTKAKRVFFFLKFQRTRRFLKTEALHILLPSESITTR